MPGIGKTLAENNARIAQQGNQGRGGYSKITAEAGYNVPKAPPKANNAPKPSTTTIGTGLVAALNEDQLARKSRGEIEIADIYQITFADDMIATAGMVPAGDFDKALAGGTSNLTAAQQLLPNKQSLDPTVRTRAARSGQQIIQFIDQVIRSSNYVIDQSRVVWNTQTQTWDLNGKPAQQFVWYNIEVVCTWLGYDRKRNDSAWRMNFVITPFETPVLSTYFDPGKFRGVHKEYNYWFTGQNTQVLSFEQAFNKQWTEAITNDVPQAESKLRTVNTREQWKTQIFAASGQSSQGAEQRVYESGANAADFLYSADLATTKITVVGDPAWLPSPLMDTVEQTFTTSPFFPDGTINTQASPGYFSIAWNRPTDYNLQTGLMDPGQNNYFANRDKGIAGLAREATTYYASTVTHTFKGGKFTQELTGQWAVLTSDAANTDANRPTNPTVATPTAQQADIRKIDNALIPTKGTQEWQRAAQNDPGSVTPATTPLAIGTQQILNPVTQSEAPSLTQLQASVAYTTARRQGATPQQALAIATQAFAQGTAGIPTPPQKIIKDGNPG